MIVRDSSKVLKENNYFKRIPTSGTDQNLNLNASTQGYNADLNLFEEQTRYKKNNLQQSQHQ